MVSPLRGILQVRNHDASLCFGWLHFHKSIFLCFYFLEEPRQRFTFANDLASLEIGTPKHTRDDLILTVKSNKIAVGKKFLLKSSVWHVVNHFLQLRG